MVSHSVRRFVVSEDQMVKKQLEELRKTSLVVTRMDPLSSREVLANIPLTAPPSTSLSSYQCQACSHCDFTRIECILYGSVLKEYEDQLIDQTGQDPDVTVRLRRKFGGSDANSLLWHFRYMSAPEADISCPTIIRKSIDSLIYSHDMMDFVKTLGLRMDYEYITKGYLFTKGNIKIVIDNITRTEKTGTYDPNLLKQLSDSLLIQMSVAQPDSNEYITSAKMLRDFADQLLP
uniref:Mediator of RNA polymerase II transcription subunit 18 n=1 Tax=Parascaris equorum TaxID=6256 RepID=A0A914RNX0_PAREQ